MTFRCDVCGKLKWNPYLGTNSLLQCRQCGLVRANLNLSPQEFEALYQHDYYFGEEYVDYLRDRSALELNFQKRINELKQKRLISKNTSIIEIGCAYGYFLNLIKNQVASHLGYDVSKEGIEYANHELGVNAVHGDFLTYSGPKADLICMWDVIEHLGQPKLMLQKIHHTLNSKGYLVLTTGDIDSVLAKIQGKHWRLIHPPTHVFYFSKQTITQLLEANGFTVESITYPPIYRNLGSIITQLIGIPLKTNLDIPLNTYDIMQVIAKKI